MLRILLFFISAATLTAGDWPMYRFSAGRGGVSPHAIPDRLALLWSRELEPAKPAWPKTQEKLQFDRVAQPVVAGGLIFVPSSASDSLTAFDTGTGEEVWCFFANGPIRFAPVAHNGKVYVQSDDGCLYALEAATGKQIWKHNGAPAERRLLGNQRLISTWPARGGAVLHNGLLYYTASIWPFHGLFIYAIDPETGAEKWRNSGDGMNFITHPHGAKAFGGLAPQGHLAASGDSLVIPGGRSTPGVFDAATGRLKHFKYDKYFGHHSVSAWSDHFAVDSRVFELETGEPAKGGVKLPVLSNGAKAAPLNPAWGLEGARQVIMAGSTVFGGGKGFVKGFHTAKNAATVDLKFKGAAEALLAGDGKLFVVTDRHELHCYGATAGPPRIHSRAATPLAGGDRKLAREILDAAGVEGGHAIFTVSGKPGLLEGLIAESELTWAGTADPAQISDLRRRFRKSGDYGSSISLSPEGAVFPRYMASLIVAENLDARLYESVRPYGGKVCVLGAAPDTSGLKGAIVEKRDGFTLVTRAGALPKTDDWTHQYANSAQTGVSRDHLVKAPLGLLWFGGPPHVGILPRHGHGPSPQVAGGRLFIEGPDMLRCVDVYTGRVLWERELREFGKYYDTTKHFAGAGEIGSNYVSLPDAVYCVYGPTIHALDVSTGKTVRKFEATLSGEDATAPNWGFLAVSGNHLVATSAPIPIGANPKKGGRNPKKNAARNQTSVIAPHANRFLSLPRGRYAPASKRLVVFDRKSGARLWEREAALNFRHNNIAVSGDTVYCIDGMTRLRRSGFAAGGYRLAGEAVLYALDLATGEVRWKAAKDIFGTFLNYSAQHDTVIEAGSAYRDRARDESGKGIRAYRGATGEVRWFNDTSHGGPCLLWRDKVITNGGGGFALSIADGIKTGWNYQRTYGCNTAVGSEHLLTFRSGAAGFYDLASGSGTGNIGGFRSSCTQNLIPANGVLNAPDYTRTCRCAYQNQTSLALIHTPEVELWAFGGQPDADRYAVNFGAPGDRRNDGLLWEAWPSPHTKSRRIITLSPGARYSRRHSAEVSGALPWVAASGVTGAGGELRIELVAPGEGPFDVGLVFGKTVKAEVRAGSVRARIEAGQRAATLKGVMPSKGRIELIVPPPLVLGGAALAPAGR